MNRLIVVALATAACIRIPPGNPGTRVEVDRVLGSKADLGALIEAELAAGRPERAFHALEVAKTRPLAAFQMANLAATTRERSPDLRPVFQNLFQTGDTETRGLAIVRAAAAPFARRQDRGDALFWDTFPRVDSIPMGVSARVPEPAEIASFEQARLVFPNDAAVASYFVHGDRAYLFWLRRGKLRAYPLEVGVATLRAEAARLLAAVRQPPSARERPWQPHAATLHAGLLGPVTDQLRSGEIATLYVSPDQFIANVPFDILTDDKGAMLVERTRVARIASVSIHRRVLYRMVDHDEPPRILAIGNPRYPTGVPDLPFAAREATAVSEIFDEASLLTGEAATEARIEELVSTYNVLHFATHGVLLGAAVPGGSSLLVTPAGDDDGFLSAAEIAQLDLGHTQLAVLSACETSIGDEHGGAIDLASLTGAFLTAGVPTVIGTLWQVDDFSTTRLMLGMYSRLHTHGPGEALRRAQLAFRGTRLADPYFWAAFVVYGWGQ